MRAFLSHALPRKIQFHCLPPIFPSCPPWAIPVPEINMNLLALPRKTTNATIYRTHFLEILNSFPKAVPCFTDGSKFKKRVGFAYSIGDETFSLRHRNCASILTTELQDIFQCLETILSLPLSHSRFFLICSDSLSLCQPSPIHLRPTLSSIVLIPSFPP